MTDKSKLMLSAEELQLVSATSWILTKRKIINNVNIFFANFADDMKAAVMAEKEWLPHAVTSSTPKIAKGENYLQLPYLILDYPRCFDKENVFAIRTMFWWGNFFSCTLHLSGNYKTMFQQNLINNIGALPLNNFYLCINEVEWQHHFEENNFIALNKLSSAEIEKIIVQQHFTKVAAKFSLHQSNEIEVLLEKSFTDALHLLKY
ncbi:hypothetical protein [Ferruginibacter sp.]